LVFGQRVRDGELSKSFDVLIFHTGLPDPGGKGRVRRALVRGRPKRVSDADLEKMIAALPAFEDWSTARDRLVSLDKKMAVPALRQFMVDGGVVIALGNQSLLAARLFDAPVRDGVLFRDKDGEERDAKSTEFFIPGSLLRVKLAENSLITTGLPQELATMFRRSPVFRVRDRDQARVLMRYPSTGELLMSGWAIGEKLLRGRAAALEVPVGKGKLYLFGADVVYRGQSQGTIKLLLNALMLGPAPTVPTSRIR